MNIPLLLRLRAADGSFVPLAVLGADQRAILRDLDELEAFGFRLERHPYLGISYQGPSSRLCPDQIERGPGPRLVGRRIAVWNRVTSTNDLAARAARSRANDGLVILAEEQIAGRGQLGRSWVAPPFSSLLLSVLIFPPAPLSAPNWLTALGAVAVAEIVERWTGRRAEIKWPNDVRVAGRKLSGILVERSAGSVIGIGLNVNSEAADFPESLRESTTSIRQLLGRCVDRSELVRELIHQLDLRYAEGLEQGSEPLEHTWRSRLEQLDCQPIRDVPWDTTLTSQVLYSEPSPSMPIAPENGSTRAVPMPEVRTLEAGDQTDIPS